MKLKPKQQAVLTFLQTYKDPMTGLCTPTLKEIASAVGISRDYAARLTKDLVEAGAIDKTKGWWLGQGGFTTDYSEAVGQADFSRGPNLYRILGVLLILMLILSTVATARPVSALEVLCYKSVAIALLALLAKKINRGGSCQI